MNVTQSQPWTRCMRLRAALGAESNQRSWTRTPFIFFWLGVSLSVMTACGGSSPQPHQLIALVVSPSGAGANQGDTVPFSATGTFAQPPITQANLPTQWTSSDISRATVDSNTGAATCVGIGGPVTITASAAGMTGTIQGTAQLTCAAPGTGPVKLVPNSLRMACYPGLPDPFICQCSRGASTILTNSLSTSLTIDSIVVGGTDFSGGSTCGTSVGPGQSCTIGVSWSPQTTGNYSGSITITDNDSTSPQTVSLGAFARCVP